MNIALFADGVNRASVSTSSAIDTLVINCVGHGTFLLYKFLLSKLLRSLPQLLASVQRKQPRDYSKNTCNLTGLTLTFHNMFYACKTP
jgi:hypothetical protein